MEKVCNIFGYYKASTCPIVVAKDNEIEWLKHMSHANDTSRSSGCTRSIENMCMSKVELSPNFTI
jgi:hypothetical protein